MHPLLGEIHTYKVPGTCIRTAEEYRILQLIRGLFSLVEQKKMVFKVSSAVYHDLCYDDSDDDFDCFNITDVTLRASYQEAWFEQEKLPRDVLCKGLELLIAKDSVPYSVTFDHAKKYYKLQIIGSKELYLIYADEQEQE